VSRFIDSHFSRIGALPDASNPVKAFLRNSLSCCWSSCKLTRWRVHLKRLGPFRHLMRPSFMRYGQRTGYQIPELTLEKRLVSFSKVSQSMK
jgi:hypothetical protein